MHDVPASGRPPRRSCRRLLSLRERRHVQLYATSAILAEVDDVLHRPKIRASFPRLTDENLEEFLAQVRALVTLVRDVPPICSLSRDPDDEPYLNLAIAVTASFIVSRDKDLCDLMNDDEFRKQYPGLTIIDPVAFLDCVRAELAKG